MYVGLVNGNFTNRKVGKCSSLQRCGDYKTGMAGRQSNSIKRFSILRALCIKRWTPAKQFYTNIVEGG